MTAPIPGSTARPPGSQPLFERARKRVTQRLSLAGLNSQSGSAKIKIPAAEQAAPVAPPPVSEHAEATLELPASVIIPLLPEAVLLADPASLLASPQGQMDYRLPLATILPMLPSGKIEFSLGDLSQCGPEGIIHPFESLGEWAAQTVLLPLPQVVMRIPPDFMTLRRDQKPIDQAVASMDDPFSPEALRAKAEAAMAAQAAAEQAAMESAAIPALVPEIPQPEIPPSEPEPESFVAQEEPPQAMAPEPAPVLEAESIPEPGPEASFPVSSSDAAPEPDFSFTQSAEYQALLSKLQTVDDAPPLMESVADVPEEPAAREPEKEESAPAPIPLPPAAPEMAPTGPARAKPSFSFSFPPKQAPTPTPSPMDPVAPPVAPLPNSPLNAALSASAPISGAFGQTSHSMGRGKTEETPATVGHSELHRLMRLPGDVPAGFKEFTHHVSLWPGMKSCVICGLDGLPIAQAGSEGKAGDSLAALAPSLFKNSSTLLADLGRPDLSEIHFPGAGESMTLFKNNHFILVIVHEAEQLPTIYLKNIREALSLLAHSGPG
jgi:predicted regulator of Ras-like GTPase activity (Roadblock/LC7/MglB family)